MTPPSNLRRSGTVRLAALAVVVGSGVLMLWSISDQRVAPRPQPLRIGINPWPGYEFAFLAEKLGYFADEGIDIRLVEFQSLGDSQLAFERGQTDGLFCSTHEFFEIERRDRRHPVPVLICDTSDGGDVIIGRADIHSVSDLRGRRIGYEPRTVNEYLLARALQQAGLTVADIELVPGSQDQIATLFNERQLDAIVTYPPVSLDYAEVVDARVVFSSRDIPSEIVDLLVIEQGIAAANSVKLEAFRRAFDRAVQFHDDHPDVALKMLAGRLGLSHEEFHRALVEDIRLVRATDQSDMLDASFINGLRTHKQSVDQFFSAKSSLAPEGAGP